MLPQDPPSEASWRLPQGFYRALCGVTGKFREGYGAETFLNIVLGLINQPQQEYKRTDQGSHFNRYQN